MHTRALIHTRIERDTHANTNTHTLEHTQTHTTTNTHAHTHTRTHTNTHAHTLLQIHTPTHTQGHVRMRDRTHTHTYTHMRTHTISLGLLSSLPSLSSPPVPSLFSFSLWYNLSMSPETCALSLPPLFPSLSSLSPSLPSSPPGVHTTLSALPRPPCNQTTTQPWCVVCP